jgi:hypothetical protein
MSSGTGLSYASVWGAAGDDVFAVGLAGTVVHYDGHSWTPIPTGFSGIILDVWGSAGSDVFAAACVGLLCSGGGALLHYDGESWSDVTPGPTGALAGVWGRTGSDVFAVGYQGTVFHYDGNSWTRMATGTTESLTGVSGSAGAGVLAVGPANTAFRAVGVPPAYGGDCTAPIPLYCGRTAVGYTGSNGLRPANFDSYGCPSGRPTTGAEVFYRLDCPIKGKVTVTLKPKVADLDLIVLGADAQGGCAPTTCVGSSQHDDTADEKVTFDAKQGERYYVVIDGYDGAVSGYNLEVLCEKKD